MYMQTVVSQIAIFAFFFSQVCLAAEEEEWIRFDCDSYENGKFITIAASGNGTTRNAHLAVYEILAPNFRMRRLHSRFLLHQCLYTQACLCSGGRFFVTKNDYQYEEKRYPLVVYDLVRNEHTSYELDGLFSPNQKMQILKVTDDPENEDNPRNPIGFYGWSQPLVESEKHFDAKSMSFTLYASGPDSLDDWRDVSQLQQVTKPFINIVIDLPTRLAKAVASSETKDLRPKGDGPHDGTDRVYLECVQQESIADAVFDKAGKRILLPRLIQMHHPNPKSQQVYRLEPETQEYVAVDASEWSNDKNDKKKGNWCIADHDKELRESLDEQVKELREKLNHQKSKQQDEGTKK